MIPPKDYSRARWRYAAFLFAQTEDLNEVARRLGVSRERARQLVREGQRQEYYDQAHAKWAELGLLEN